MKTTKELLVAVGLTIVGFFLMIGSVEYAILPFGIGLLGTGYTLKQ